MNSYQELLDRIYAERKRSTERLAKRLAEDAAWLRYCEFTAADYMPFQIPNFKLQIPNSP